ncbi:hypothetical protein AB0G67_48570 [Streptomyces sp. NPDC021056]|uniref:hypothetical protein n=1 Tax=Streptomyces sp. NPDC021056 TaxID=3155012 RepID=UPI0033C03F67
MAAFVVLAGLGSDAAGLRAQNELVGSVHGLRNTVIRGLLEKYPQLAEEFRVSREEFAAADTRARYELTEQGRRPLPEAVEG